jgi:hypothetical protein
MSKLLLEYAARDIPFTGLACTVMINLGRRRLAIDNTINKVFEFEKVNRMDDTPLASAILRHSAFAAGRYRKPPTEIVGEYGLRTVLGLWICVRDLMFGERTVKRKLTEMDDGVLERDAEELEKLLEEHMDEIRGLAGLSK